MPSRRSSSPAATGKSSGKKKQQQRRGGGRGRSSSSPRDVAALAADMLSSPSRSRSSRSASSASCSPSRRRGKGGRRRGGRREESRGLRRSRSAPASASSSASRRSRPRSASPPRGGKAVRTAKGWGEVSPRTVGQRRAMPAGCFVEPDSAAPKEKRHPKYPICPAKGENKNRVTSEGLLAAAQRAFLNLRTAGRKAAKEESKRGDVARHRFVLARVLRIAIAEREEALRAAGKDKAKIRDAANYWAWVDVRDPASNQMRRFVEEAMKKGAGAGAGGKKTEKSKSKSRSKSRSKSKSKKHESSRRSERHHHK